MQQGEIWEMYFDPVKGREQSGRRPAVIISGDLLNKYLDIVIVCPLTTSVKNYKGNVVLEPNHNNGLQQASEILTFHIRSVSKGRLKKKIGTITPQQLTDLKIGLEDILRY
ncbi:MAG: type II toxin-antitoxin system PemK/MazF family toxin [Owenweeksia sp.]